MIAYTVKKPALPIAGIPSDLLYVRRIEIGIGWRFRHLIVWPVNYDHRAFARPTVTGIKCISTIVHKNFRVIWTGKGQIPFDSGFICIRYSYHIVGCKTKIQRFETGATATSHGG